MNKTLLCALAVTPLLAQWPNQGPPSHYEADWEVIRKHPLPEWFDNAKLGIFVHWGLYSVPAWAPPSGELGKVDMATWFKVNPYAEWYMNTMLIAGSATQQHHEKTYGRDFDYLRFAESFNREAKKWRPEEWTALFQQAGARYVVLTSKHHDGWTLWPSKVRNPHRPESLQGSERDIVGELSTAVRAKGMRMGLYYSGGLDWSFQPGPVEKMADLFKNVPQTEEYARYADAHWRELIDRYQPASMWNDISYPKKGDLRGLFAHYLNTVKDGVINNRFGADFSDFTTPEYSRFDKVTPKKWEACRGLGFSFGYNQAEGPQHVLPADELIDLLADIVSKNGNLLLNVGPKPDGSISEMQIERLRALGDWLRVNGEAIFDTRPWHVAQSKTADGGRVRFTRKKGTVYAFLLDEPKAETVSIENVFGADGMSVELLGGAGKLAWKQSGRNLTVTLPADRKKSHAYALKMSPAPMQVVGE